MAEPLDLETLIKTVFDRSNRHRKNPARAQSVSMGVLDEMPMQVTASKYNVLSPPKWGDLGTGGNISENFTNTGNSDVNLTTSTAATWTARVGVINIDSADFAKYSSGTSPIYTVTLLTTDMRVALRAFEAATHWGVVFRYSDTNNYWWLGYSGGADLGLYKVSGGVEQLIAGPLSSSQGGDGISVTCVGSRIRSYWNRQLVDSRVDSFLEGFKHCGITFRGLTSGAHIESFRAWSIETTSFDYNYHTFFNCPEVY